MNITMTYLNDRVATEQWDNYVQAHNAATAYHYSAWLQAVETSYNQQSLLLMAFEQGQLVGVMPLVLMARPIFRNALCALPYCDMGHALADTSEQKQALLKYASEFAKTQGIASVDYREGEMQTPISQTQLAEFAGQKVTMKMPLAANADEQMAAYKSKLRSQIRKAEKNGLTIKLSQKADLLDDFYRVFTHNMRDLGSPTHSKCWFANIMMFYQERACMAVVYKDYTPIGAGIILLHEHLCSIPWASTIATYNRLAPNMLLYAHLIGFAADKGIPTFDFGRSTLNEGTYKFKKQWGAQPYPLKWSNIGNVAEHIDEMNTDTQSLLKDSIIQIWRNLPLSLTTTVGSRVRGYISL